MSEFLLNKQEPIKFQCQPNINVDHPTVAGWYWIKFTSKSDWFPVKIVGPQNDLRFDFGRSIFDFKTYEWGPLIPNPDQLQQINEDLKKLNEEI